MTRPRLIELSDPVDITVDPVTNRIYVLHPFPGPQFRVFDGTTHALVGFGNTSGGATGGERITVNPATGLRDVRKDAGAFFWAYAGAGGPLLFAVVDVPGDALVANPTTNHLFVKVGRDTAVKVLDGVLHKLLGTVTLGEAGSVPSTTAGIATNPATNHTYVVTRTGVAVIGDGVPATARVPICGDQDGSETPLIFNCPRFAASPDVRTYQVPGTGPVDLRFDFVYRETSFANELAYYKVDGPAGEVNGLRPGDLGYLAAGTPGAAHGDLPQRL